MNEPYQIEKALQEALEEISCLENAIKTKQNYLIKLQDYVEILKDLIKDIKK